MTTTTAGTLGRHRGGFRYGYALFALAASLMASPARAFINDYNIFANLESSPDIASYFVNLVYTAANGQLTASNPVGGTSPLTLSSNPLPLGYAITDGQFSLSANIDPNTGNAIDGSLDIFGTISVLGFSSGTLLHGTLSGFGSGTLEGDSLKFLFTSLSGDAAGLFGGTGGRAGVLLSSGNFPGDIPAHAFRASFADTSAAADTAGVPEPPTWLLFAGSIPVLIRRHAPPQAG